MSDNFRAADHKFYGSDAFFCQWKAAEHKNSIRDLPERFPTKFYRNNIKNKDLGGRLEKLLGEESELYIDPTHKDWDELQGTHNIKSTNNIIRDFNTLNRTRKGPQAIVKGMKIMRVPGGAGLRFDVGHNDDEALNRSQ